VRGLRTIIDRLRVAAPLAIEDAVQVLRRKRESFDGHEPDSV
jgi:hypothetical protein